MEHRAINIEVGSSYLQIIGRIREIHRYDQNFPGSALAKIDDFLNNPDVRERPEKHMELIHEMKMEAILATEVSPTHIISSPCYTPAEDLQNSPYAEVRANVDATDDPTMPSLTIRVWLIGCIFAAIGSFIDSFFLMRNPPVSIGANVAQLLSCELFRSTIKVAPANGAQIPVESSWLVSCQTTGSGSLVANTVSTPVNSTKRNTC